jgi:hypothetical protein
MVFGVMLVSFLQQYNNEWILNKSMTVKTSIQSHAYHYLIKKNTLLKNLQNFA